VCGVLIGVDVWGIWGGCQEEEDHCAEPFEAADSKDTAMPDETGAEGVEGGEEHKRDDEDAGDEEGEGEGEEEKEEEEIVEEDAGTGGQAEAEAGPKGAEGGAGGGADQQRPDGGEAPNADAGESSAGQPCPATTRWPTEDTATDTFSPDHCVLAIMSRKGGGRA
jgi:hypothetical protein